MVILGRFFIRKEILYIFRIIASSQLILHLNSHHYMPVYTLVLVFRFVYYGLLVLADDFSRSMHKIFDETRLSTSTSLLFIHNPFLLISGYHRDGQKVRNIPVSAKLHFCNVPIFLQVALPTYIYLVKLRNVCNLFILYLDECQRKGDMCLLFTSSVYLQHSTLTLSFQLLCISFY